MIKADSIPTYNSKVAYRNIDDQIVIVQPLDENILTLNKTGSFIWTLIEKISVDEIADEVVKKFEVNKDEALKDVIELLTALKEKNLIEI
ncbi:MAG: PqqD family protein [Deltaproteobacteria bacterium]|nr:PqqD family protein [Deltaproteobacteria bacterium]